MEEELKSFKISLDYVDKDGNLSVKDYTIKVSKPKFKEDVKITYTKYYSLYTLLFSLVLPDHIHATLKGASVSTNDLYGAITTKESKKYDNDLSKTVSASTLEQLTKRYAQMLYDYRWLKQIENAELTKTIFYRFKTKSNDVQSRWDGIPLGKSTDISYSFLIGYSSIVNDKEYRYNGIKKLINRYNDKEFYDEYKSIRWTPEREIFFQNIDSSFNKLISQLNNFEENLTEDKIELLMSSSPFLLGA